MLQGSSTTVVFCKSSAPQQGRADSRVETNQGRHQPFERKLIEEAKKEHRSLTNYLETTLTKLWEQQESGDACLVQSTAREVNHGLNSSGCLAAMGRFLTGCTDTTRIGDAALADSISAAGLAP